MADTATLDQSLAGKSVVASDGEPFGVVAGVRSGTLYVDLDSGLSDRLQARLGWDGGEDEEYPLGTSAIEYVTDDAVYLNDL